jgi:hypothetical protein
MEKIICSVFKIPPQIKNEFAGSIAKLTFRVHNFDANNPRRQLSPARLPLRHVYFAFAYEVDRHAEREKEEKVHTLMAQQGDRVTRFLIALIALNGDADQSFQRYKLIMGQC